MPRTTIHKAHTPTPNRTNNRPDTALYLRIERNDPTSASDAGTTTPTPAIIEHTARYPTMEQAHQAAANFLAISPLITKVYLLDAQHNILAIVTRQANPT